MKRILVSISCVLLWSSMFASPVPMRGVVEGYYGRPWGTQGRMQLLEFMGENDMNVFIYGPKDDPYHHAKWREPYPENDLSDFKKLLEISRRNKIDFYWAIHLGSGFRKDSADDYAALFRKLGWMYDAGFRSFAVFFDDFGAADADFHAEICNRIKKEFVDAKAGCSPLIMCPNVYWGHGHAYHKTLGEKLDKSVHIMWTGRGICSDIRAEDVAKITEDFRRPPFIWWNWPVNDYCRSKILLGRTYGLDDIKCSGFVANPMENCQANKIALYGVAKWCLDPSNFKSREVWEESFGKIYKDPAIANAMRVFAEHNSDQGPNGHGYRREESVSARELCSNALKQFEREGFIDMAQQKKLRALFNKLCRASQLLLSKLPKERYDLGWEIEGWLEAQKYYMQIALMSLDMLNAYHCGRDVKKIAVDIMRLRGAQEESAIRHREKFAAATFAGDKQWIAKPAVATLVLAPLIDTVLEKTLKNIYAKKNGKAFNASLGFEAFTDAKGFSVPAVKLDGKYAGMARVMEFNEIAPGESFGIKVPEKWQTDYFHAKLGGEDPVKAGVIEVSKNGIDWTKLNTHNHGENMELPLSAGDKWRFARYRNVSTAKVRFKINQFKFDVKSVASAIDELLIDAAK